MVKGIVQQQAQIRADAVALERLQSQASTADGQMKALMAANQLAALEQEQLLQIRAVLLQQQQALAGRNATLANDEAMREAATKWLNSNKGTKSDMETKRQGKTWTASVRVF